MKVMSFNKERIFLCELSLPKLFILPFNALEKKPFMNLLIQ